MLYAFLGLVERTLESAADLFSPPAASDVETRGAEPFLRPGSGTSPEDVLCARPSACPTRRAAYLPRYKCRTSLPLRA